MIKILRKFFARRKSLRKTLEFELVKIRQEFEEHLQAINENTNEISANYEYICEVENKVEKLNETIEQVQMMFESNYGTSIKRSVFNVKQLNRKEQEVFLVIYTLEEEKGNLTYEDIARKLNVSEHLAASYVTCLIEKGIPIIKRYINSKPHLKLDPEFKTLQTKENILQLKLEEFGF